MERLECSPSMHVGRGWTSSLCAYNYFAECNYSVNVEVEKVVGKESSLMAYFETKRTVFILLGF